ncbi:hypothetical protein NC652_030800 [Populus alba x Populus x berolinensis]|nr:hypothetical protein NC652_030800 [Populus alba x Populus x berolinensis]
MGPKKVNMEEDNSSSRAVRTERTILSPFTKEYRVLAANSGIRLFLEGSLRQNESPNNSSMKVIP